MYKKKKQVLTFNCQPSSYLKGKFKFKWGEDYLKYLGVQIPKDITDLFDVNCKPLYSTMKSELARLESSAISSQVYLYSTFHKAAPQY